MFERDKDELRRAGFSLSFDEERMTYSLDRGATFAAPLSLSDSEAATVRAVGTALLDDPSFPFQSDLRLALAKIASQTETGSLETASVLADESPDTQGRAAHQLSVAVDGRKRVSFSYRNSDGDAKPHDVEPYGLFLHDGRWYLVGRDVAIDEQRTYALSRTSDLEMNRQAPKSPDFERPADFDVATFVRLPFQYGPEGDGFQAVLEFSADSAWRARSLAAGHGTLTENDTGITWRVDARSESALIRFAIENGPGISIGEPEHLAAHLRAGCADVEVRHGR
jgi:predicted DNA-binding transcriptional regulator YafY